MLQVPCRVSQLVYETLPNKSIEVKKNLEEGQARGFQEKMLTAKVTQLTQLTKSVY